MIECESGSDDMSLATLLLIYKCNTWYEISCVQDWVDRRNLCVPRIATRARRCHDASGQFASTLCRQLVMFPALACSTYVGDCPKTKFPLLDPPPKLKLPPGGA